MPSLTGEQLAVIQAMQDPQRKNYVSAAPGSGKTTTLEYGVQEIQSPFVAITFTNKAAKELRRRLRNPNALFIGTFHGLCIHCARAMGIVARILDDDESFAIFKKCSSGIIRKEEIQIWRSRIDYARSWSSPRDRISANYEGSELEKMTQVYTLYQAAKEGKGVWDFNDILHVGVLHINPDTINPALVLVDEWQDTNEIQYFILRMLTDNWRKGFTVVGDQDQTLYEFRGACYENTRRLIGETNPQVFPLGQTWRFGREIADRCNTLIAFNPNRLQTSIVPNESVLSRVEQRSFYSSTIEASEIADRVERESGTFAVLCRTAMQMFPIERAFISAHIRYTKLGGLKLSERAKIKRLMDVIIWAIHAEESNLLRFLKSLKLGLGKRFLAQYNLSTFEGMEDNAKYLALVLQELDPLDVTQEPALEHKRQLAAVLKLSQFVDRIDTKSPLLADLVGAFVEESSSLIELLDNLTLASSSDEEAGDVTIATVHAVKGLEFDSVWIPGMEEGIFPHAKSGLSELESERRIVYVAMSRAKRSLTLSYCSTRKTKEGDVASSPSRFLRDMGQSEGPSSSPLGRQSPW